MPSIFTIPERKEAHCEPCEFHNCMNEVHVRIGPGSYREFECTHPQAHFDTEEEMDEKTKAFFRDTPRYIGRTPLQPHWCPLKRIEP